jgi:hypothetical protein
MHRVEGKSTTHPEWRHFPPWRSSMSTETIIIIVVLIFLFGGGGFFWSRRR